MEIISLGVSTLMGHVKRFIHPPTSLNTKSARISLWINNGAFAFSLYTPPWWHLLLYMEHIMLHLRAVINVKSSCMYKAPGPCAVPFGQANVTLN